VESVRVGAQGLDQARLRRGKQLREPSEVAVTSRRQSQRGIQIDAYHVAARREPQLTLAGEQRLPGFMLLPVDRGVLAIRVFR
jgi:hypothetical protein